MAAGLLVYPGLGHFFLKRFRRGILWALVFSVPMAGCLYLVGSELTSLSVKLLSPTGDPDFDITPLVKGLALSLVGIVVYLAAAVDCWLISRRSEARTDLPAEP